MTDVTFLRLPVIYGWTDRSRIESYFAPMLRGEPEIIIANDLMPFRISRTLHKNAADAVRLAAEAMPKGHKIYNVGEQDTLSELEWAQRLADLSGWRGTFIEGANHWQHNPQQDIAVDTTAIRSDLGYAEVFDPIDGLRDCIAFYAMQEAGRPYDKGY